MGLTFTPGKVGDEIVTLHDCGAISIGRFQPEGQVLLIRNGQRRPLAIPTLWSQYEELLNRSGPQVGMTGEGWKSRPQCCGVD